MQPRHFVLVLVGHEFEEITRHCLGQRGLAQRRFDGSHLLHKGLVSLRVSRVLVGRQKINSRGEHLGKRWFFYELNNLRGLE